MFGGTAGPETLCCLNGRRAEAAGSPHDCRRIPGLGSGGRHRRAMAAPGRAAGEDGARHGPQWQHPWRTCLAAHQRARPAGKPLPRRDRPRRDPARARGPQHAGPGYRHHLRSARRTPGLAEPRGADRNPLAPERGRDAGQSLGLRPRSPRLPNRCPRHRPHRRRSAPPRARRRLAGAARTARPR